MSNTIGSFSTPSAFQSAEQGIRRGLNGLDQDAAKVAGAGISGGADSTAGAMVDASQQKLIVQASARALSITDETLGTIIDMKA